MLARQRFRQTRLCQKIWKKRLYFDLLQAEIRDRHQHQLGDALTTMFNRRVFSRRSLLTGTTASFATAGLGNLGGRPLTSGWSQRETGGTPCLDGRRQPSLSPDW